MAKLTIEEAIARAKELSRSAPAHTPTYSPPRPTAQPLTAHKSISGICDLCGKDKPVLTKSADGRFKICWSCKGEMETAYGKSWGTKARAMCEIAIKQRAEAAEKRLVKLNERRATAARKKAFREERAKITSW